MSNESRYDSFSADFRLLIASKIRSWVDWISCVSSDLMNSCMTWVWWAFKILFCLSFWFFDRRRIELKRMILDMSKILAAHILISSELFSRNFLALTMRVARDWLIFIMRDKMIELRWNWSEIEVIELKKNWWSGDDWIEKELMKWRWLNWKREIGIEEELRSKKVKNRRWNGSSGSMQFHVFNANSHFEEIIDLSELTNSFEYI